MSAEAKSPEQNKMFSGLIDFLKRERERIDWYKGLKSCSDDERPYQGEQLRGRRDNEFRLTSYRTSLLCGEIILRFDID